MAVHLAYDLDAGALYVTLTGGVVASTVEVDDGTLVDLDDGGALVGIEVLDYRRPWPLEEIASRWPMSGPHLDGLRAVLSAGHVPTLTICPTHADR